MLDLVRGYQKVPTRQKITGMRQRDMTKKFLSLEERRAYRCLEDVVGCKWSAAVVAAINEGVNRPGKLERYIPGISTKVLNQRLRRLQEYELITKEDLSSSILHVEYSLTDSGRKLAYVIEQIHSLQSEHNATLSRSEDLETEPRQEDEKSS